MVRSSQDRNLRIIYFPYSYNSLKWRFMQKLTKQEKEYLYLPEQSNLKVDLINSLENHHKFPFLILQKSSKGCKALNFFKKSQEAVENSCITLFPTADHNY